MMKIIDRILGYALGFGVIYSVIPNRGLNEFGIVTLGGLIIIFSTILFPYNKD